MRNIDVDRRKLAILIVATILRFYDLGKTPLFFDESVHTVFVDQIPNYVYDPAFHGPLLFYLTSIAVLLGKNEFTYRIVPAIFGVLTVALLLKFERFMGRSAYISALLVAVSPIIVNYSRFFRNESQVLFFTLSFVYFTFRYLEERRWYHLALSSVSLALFACSKENFYPIALIVLPYFLMKIRNFRLKDIIISILIFLFIYIFIYTNFLTYIKPLIDLSEFPAVKALSYWKHQHEIARIGGPLWYYIPLLILYDLPVLTVGIYTIFEWIYKRDLNFFRSFLIYWFVTNLVFYSYVQEKVPWLTVHIELPLYMIAGFMYKKRMLTIFTVAFLTYSSVHLNIINPTNPAEPALYLPTSMDVKEIGFEKGSNVCIFMTPGDYWPLPFYLKGYKTYYYQSIEKFQSALKLCDVVILNWTNTLKLDGTFKYEKKYEICLRSWVVYNPDPLKFLEFMIFRKPMGEVYHFNHTVYIIKARG